MLNDSQKDSCSCPMQLSPKKNTNISCSFYLSLIERTYFNVFASGKVHSQKWDNFYLFMLLSFSLNGAHGFISARFVYNFKSHFFVSLFIYLRPMRNGIRMGRSTLYQMVKFFNQSIDVFDI